MDSRFVYVIYIASTAESVFQALVQGDVTRQYWGPAREGEGLYASARCDDA